MPNLHTVPSTMDLPSVLSTQRTGYPLVLRDWHNIISDSRTLRVTCSGCNLQGETSYYQIPLNLHEYEERYLQSALAFLSSGGCPHATVSERSRIIADLHDSIYGFPVGTFTNSPISGDFPIESPCSGGLSSSEPPRATRTVATAMSKLKNNRYLVGCDKSVSKFCNWEKKLKQSNLLSREYDLDGEVPDYV